MPLQAIEPQRLYQRVAEQLAELIRDGEFDEGRKLPAERELAKMLGVSRPVVREAMVALEIAGLVEVRTGSGTHVTIAPPDADVDAEPARSPEESPGDLNDLFQARSLIEGEVAALAAEMVDSRAMGAIEAAALALRAAMRAEREHREADHAFHTAVAAAAGNSVLARVVEQLWHDTNPPSRRNSSRRSPERLAEALAEHQAILDAVRSHDADSARRAMRVHIGAVERG